MKKYVRVMDGLKSNAGGFEYKLNEINVANVWNPSTNNPKEMGGFNFSTTDKILRWLHRGDTIYDVIIPDDADVILCDEDKGVYRANKIIVNNPRKITDEMVMEFYKINTLPSKVVYQCLVTLLYKKRINIAKYIINDYITINNIKDAIEEFENYVSKENLAIHNLHLPLDVIYIRNGSLSLFFHFLYHLCNISLLSHTLHLYLFFHLPSYFYSLFWHMN